HQYAGLPHLATGQAAVLYPPTYLAVAVAGGLGDLRWAMDILAIAHLALAALGMFLVLRSLGLGRGGGDLVGALLWACAPFVVIVSRAWIPYAYAAAFVPWSFWLLLGLLRRPGWTRALAYGSLKSLFFFTGHPQMLVYSSLIEGLYWLLSAAGELRSGAQTLGHLARQAAGLAGAATWTAATSAPLLLPMLGAVRASFMRSEPLPLEVFAQYSMQPLDFAAAQIFIFREKVFLDAGSSIFFMGPVALAALVYFALRCRGINTPVTRLAAVAALAFLAATPAWRLIYGLPVLSTFRWPAKTFLFFFFASVPAICLAFETFSERRPRRARAAAALALLSCVGVLLVPEWRRSMGEATLERPLAEYRGHLAELCPGPGRIVALRQIDTPAPVPWDQLAPLMAGYNYATLLERHQLGGYEPLVSTLHYRLSARMSYTATLPIEAVQRPEVLRHLAWWGVDCVLVPEFEGVRETLALAPSLRPSGSRSGILAYRLDAAPLVAPVDRPGRALDFEWTRSGLTVRLSGESGPLRVAVAPAGSWRVVADGSRPAEWRLDPRAGLVIEPPPGARRLTLEYRDPALEAGLLIAALAAACALLARLLARRLDARGQGSSRARP
ncbi:MAG: hypothetical protein AAF725_13245, partial [Acidobacteriota bacterium]